MGQIVEQAVVLVGGRGTRLGKLTDKTPKPLMPITPDRTFLDFLLAKLAHSGVRNILLSAGHMADQFDARYQGKRIGQAEIKLIVEPSPAGTAGALKSAEPELDDLFLMLNGDTLFDIDFEKLSQSLQPDDLGTLALRPVADASRYGRVEHAQGRILAFAEKTTDSSGPAEISGGVYILRRAVLGYIPQPPSSLEMHVFPNLAQMRRLGCVVFDEYFIDIGLPDTLEQARKELQDVVDFSPHIRSMGG
jgi:NDP-sugar pyrophosphorylase family protein